MALREYVRKVIEEKGWLAISSLCFDNAYIINIFNTSGYVAFSPSEQMYMSYNSLDTTDTEAIESQYCIIPMHETACQMAITFADEECLQHFDMASYGHYNFLYNDEADKAAFAKIPTKDEIMACVKDPDTGLYTGPGITVNATRLSGKDQSVIPMYEEYYDWFNKGEYFSGARVDFWVKFYQNHEKFKVLLAEKFGITDAI